MARFSLDRKLFAIVAIFGASILATTWFAGLQSFLDFFPPAFKTQAPSHMDSTQDSSLPEFSLDKVLQDAGPIFGKYKNVQSETSNWMSRYPDETKVVHMNIPGVHDAATWNYSAATQKSLKPVTDLMDDTDLSPEWFRCQDTSMIDMLNAGIHAFDLRYAQDVTNTTLVFWHGPALQSQTATVEDVLFAFYKWLDDHPSEVVLLSFQYEANAAMRNIDTADVQMKLYNAFTSPAAKKYILQSRDHFGTLGSARGKIILLRRFDLNLLPESYEATIPGIHFSPRQWTVNSPAIELTYSFSPPENEDGEEGTAYIEDYYRPHTQPSSTLAENIDMKFDAIKSHLTQAASNAHPDALFWTFTSGTNVWNQDGVEDVTPRRLALGEGSVEGVNERVLELLKGMSGERLGIVMVDYFEQPARLVEVILGSKEPK